MESRAGRTCGFSNNEPGSQMYRRNGTECPFMNGRRVKSGVIRPDGGCRRKRGRISRWEWQRGRADKTSQSCDHLRPTLAGYKAQKFFEVPIHTVAIFWGAAWRDRPVVEPGITLYGGESQKTALFRWPRGAGVSYQL